MINALSKETIDCRVKTSGNDLIDNTAIPIGAFDFKREGLFVIAGMGNGWDHISISKPKHKNRHKIPTWNEMCFVKNLFFDKEELVVQYHPPLSKYVNVHPGVLHLWRKQDDSIPVPPLYMV